MTRFETLNELHYRGLLEFQAIQTEEWRLQHALQAVEGELITCFNKSLPDYVEWIPHLSIDYYGPVQVDLLIMADYLWWVIDWQQPYIDSKRPRDTLLNHLRPLKELARSLDRKIEVRVDQLNPDLMGIIKISSSHEILAWSQRKLQAHIQDLVDQVTFTSGDKICQYHRVLNRYHKPIHEELPTIELENWRYLKKGCRCLNCQSYTLKIKRKTCQCLHCGKTFTKRQMAERLYYQLQALSHHDHVKMSREWLLELCDYQLRSTSIWTTMQAQKKPNQSDTATCTRRKIKLK